jgi:hypothetical protein
MQHFHHSLHKFFFLLFNNFLTKIFFNEYKCEIQIVKTKYEN